MYQKAYGIIETLAPLHVGASAGEETGNLNLIFRDQFTQTGIIPGSSIRGRFRADMRLRRQQWFKKKFEENNIELPERNSEVDWRAVDQAWLKHLETQLEEQNINLSSRNNATDWKLVRREAKRLNLDIPNDINENYWYGYEAVAGQEDGGTTEALIKFEYASLVWLPVFCPGQPVVWVTCPWLLKRYKNLANIKSKIPEPYTASKGLIGRGSESRGIVLFFNLGFLEIEHEVDSEDLQPWIPPGTDLEPSDLVVVDNNDIGMLHDMALYRQSRVKLLDEMKKVDTERGAFFNVEALPEGSILAFPIACKDKGWQPFGADSRRNDVNSEQSNASDEQPNAEGEQPNASDEQPNGEGEQLSAEGEQSHVNGKKSHDLYFGGLESIGFGHCRVTLQEVSQEAE
ncbi:MAG: type III-B CRISPR module RAMP protein Cmr4 [Leptolyngbyaceae cyanobacterium RU_5_1]|nr:type III-B CRISPR module RAMP protein Cmr4 [Leptolyngbyaceae cyanobacterium RU_5_1]